MSPLHSECGQFSSVYNVSAIMNYMSKSFELDTRQIFAHSERECCKCDDQRAAAVFLGEFAYMIEKCGSVSGYLQYPARFRCPCSL